jgi:uncharacterized membrane protein YtjA (UPF0391 family)
MVGLCQAHGSIPAFCNELSQNGALRHDSPAVAFSCPAACGTTLREPQFFVSVVMLNLVLLEAGMLGWAVTFFLIALIAALFGFGGIAAAASGIAQILFVIFLVLFLVSLVIALIQRGSAT